VIVWTDVERMRQLRGLIQHVKPLLPTPQGERLIRGDRLKLTAGWTKEPTRATCIWCEAPLEGRARKWHPYCKAAYSAAIGLTVYQNQTRRLIPPGPCVTCSRPYDLTLPPLYVGHALDHRISFEVGWALGPEVELRVRDIANLQWLCHVCHVAKTRRDRETAAEARRMFVGVA